MEAEDPLNELADIHLPDAVTFWPPAPGWWVVAALVVLALVLLYRQQLARIFLRRRLGSALRELDMALNRFKKQPPAQRNAAGLQLLQSFNAILKRVALVHYADPELPKMNGRPWLRFLDAQMHGTAFSTGVGQVLGDGMYRPVFDADVDALHALCRRWIEQNYLRKTQQEQQPAALPSPAPLSGEARP